MCWSFQVQYTRVADGEQQGGYGEKVDADRGPVALLLKLCHVALEIQDSMSCGDVTEKFACS